MVITVEKLTVRSLNHLGNFMWKKITKKEYEKLTDLEKQTYQVNAMLHRMFETNITLRENFGLKKK